MTIDLDSVMERIGRVVAADRALDVKVRGTQAYSVPGRIVIPNIETFAWLGENAERMLHGLLDHECGHAKFTEHSFFSAAGEEKGQPFKSLLNMIEDAWIERRIIHEWPGAAHNLDRKNRWFWTQEAWQKGFAEADAWSAYLLAACVYTRGAATLDEIRAKREDVAKMIESSEKLLARTRVIRTTRAAHALAKDVWEHFKKEIEPPPPPPPIPMPAPEEEEEAPEPEESEEETEGESGSTDDSDDEGDEGDENEGEGPEGEKDEDTEGDEGGEEGPHDEPGEGTDEEGDEPSDDEPGSPAGGDPSDEPGEESEGASGDSEGEGGMPEPMKEELREIFDSPEHWSPETPTNPEEAIRKEIEMRLGDGTDEYILFSREFDRERDFTVSYAGVEATEPLAQIEKDAHTASDAFAQSFEVALRARRYKRPIGGHDEGEVDETLITEFALGSAPADTIYRQYVSEDDREVAVAILLDCSGSMGTMIRETAKTKIWLARRVAAALSMALSRCNVPHEVTGFTTFASGGTDGHRWAEGQQAELDANFLAMRTALAEAERCSGQHPGVYARELDHWRNGTSATWAHHPLVVPVHAVFKSYDLESLAGLVYADGIYENLDGEAVLWQARRLALRPEPRRVMFVLSDGLPLGARPGSDQSGYLKRAVERVAESGIEIYGIGMADTSVREFYPTHWVANKMTDLLEIAFGSLVEVLTTNRSEQECIHLNE